MARSLLPGATLAAPFCRDCTASFSGEHSPAGRQLSRGLHLGSPAPSSHRAARLRVFAADGEPSAVTSPAEGEAKKKNVIRRVKKEPPPAEENLELKSLEDPATSFEGVVRIDKGGSLSLGQLALLAGGDALSLILFAYIGRVTHVSTAVDFELFKTALPFLTGWLLSALVLGDYSPSRPLPQGFGSVASSTAKTWALGLPLGIAIRSAFKGQPPQLPFALVSLITTAVFLTGWRTLYFSLAAKGEEQEAGNREKTGNVFEFFEVKGSKTLNDCHS